MQERPTLLINGAASPVGKALALHSAEHYRLALYDEDSVGCRQLAQQLHLKEFEALSLVVDRNLRDNVAEHVIGRAVNRWKSLDVVINLPPPQLVSGPFLAIDTALWQQQFQQQTLQTLHWCQAALAIMSRHQQGLIINVSHSPTLIPTGHSSLQDTLFAATSALTHSLDQEYAGHGIRVLEHVFSAETEETQQRILASDPLSKARLQRSLANHQQSAEQLMAGIWAQLRQPGVVGSKAPGPAWRRLGALFGQKFASKKH